MYVCICNAVTERDIEALKNEGVSTMSQLEERLPIAEGCGGCRDSAERVLRRRHA
jgi:bacterioferritin-associated ferredoxin